MKNPEIQPALDAIGFEKDLSGAEDILTKKTIFIRPNPTIGTFEILFDHQDMIPQQIEITDINGHTVLQIAENIGLSNRVDLSGFYTKGIFFVKLKYHDQIIVKKVIMY